MRLKIQYDGKSEKILQNFLGTKQGHRRWGHSEGVARAQLKGSGVTELEVAGYGRKKMREDGTVRARRGRR